MKSSSNLFKWKHFEADIILLMVRWYLQYRLSYRELVEMMSERGISISHTTIMEGTEKGRVFYYPRYDIAPFPNKWVKKLGN